MANEEIRALWREQKRKYRERRKIYTLILSLGDAKKVEKHAKAKCMSVPEFIKALTGSYEGETKYITPKDSRLRDLIIEVRRIGNNMNQLVRYCHERKSVQMSDIEALQQYLSKLERMITDTLTNPKKSDH